MSKTLLYAVLHLTWFLVAPKPGDPTTLRNGKFQWCYLDPIELKWFICPDQNWVRPQERSGPEGDP